MNKSLKTIVRSFLSCPEALHHDLPERDPSHDLNDLYPGREYRQVVLVDGQEVSSLQQDP